MRTFLNLFLLCFTATHAAAQTFDVNYHVGAQVNHLSIEQDGNGCIITASLLGSNPSTNHLQRMAFDSIGLVRWTTDWCDSVTQLGSGNAVAPAWGSGFVHCCYDNSVGNWLLFRTDRQGDLVWLNAVHPPAPFFLISDPQNVIRVAGGYVFAGDVQSAFTGSYVQMIKTDTAGNILWARFLNKSNQKDYHYGLTECTDHDIVVACSRVDTLNNTGKGIVVTRVDSSGNLRWSQFLTPANNSWPVAVAATPDNGVAVAGFTYNGSFMNTVATQLIKMDAAGTVQWARMYSTPAGIGAKELMVAASGNLVVACAMFGQTALFETDGNGTLLWSASHLSSLLYDAALVPGGIVLCSRSGMYPLDSIIITRTDAFGRTNCNDIEFVPVVSTVALSTYPVPFDSVVVPQLMTKQFTDLHVQLTPSYNCLSQVGMQEPVAASACAVFPVPANEQLQIRNTGQCTRLELYAGDGRCIWSSQPGTGEVTIYTGGYPPGFYVLRASLNTGEALTRKIIIAR